MKVVFVGPSLPDAADHAGPGVIVRPPARQGDVIAAVEEGATGIGLIDGYFELVAPVWHKELLYALSKRIPVLGAASMGALRAAECHAFGMQGVGQIFNDYHQGVRVDDADVALLHGPQELGYPAITVALVNVDATLVKAQALRLLSEEDAAALSQSARHLFYKDRTWKAVAGEAGLSWDTVRAWLKLAFVDQKRNDAGQLMALLPDASSPPARVDAWDFHKTPLWREMFD